MENFLIAKVAYVNYLLDVNQLSGVVNKLLAQAKALRFANIPIKVILFTCSNFHHDDIEVIMIPSGLGPWGRQRFVVRTLLRAYGEGDILILRKLTYSPMLYWLLRQKTFKLIMEYHTLDRNLYKLSRRRLVYLSASLAGKLMEPLIAAKVTVTHEIKIQEQKSHGTQLPIEVIPNGVMLSDGLQGQMPVFDGKHLTMVFVASQYHAYHGLERVLLGMLGYHGEVKLTLVMVGLAMEDLPGATQSLLLQVGEKVCLKQEAQLSAKALALVYAGCHLGLGTLGLYKLSMREACSLKVREYLRYGLPFVYAGNDVEFSGDEMFCLQVDDEDVPLAMIEVIAFVNQLSDKRDKLLAACQAKMVEISLENKMAQYYQLAQRVAHGGAVLPDTHVDPGVSQEELR